MIQGYAIPNATMLGNNGAYKSEFYKALEGDWRKNRDAIDRDLPGESWWLRNNDTSNKHNGSS